MNAKVCKKIVINDDGGKKVWETKILEVGTKKISDMPSKATMTRRSKVHNISLEELAQNNQSVKNKLLSRSLSSLASSDAVEVLKGNNALKSVTRVSTENSANLQLGSNLGYTLNKKKIQGLV